MKRAVSFIGLTALILSLMVYIPFVSNVAAESVTPEAVWASSYEQGYGGFPYQYATDGNPWTMWLSGSEAVKRIALKVYGGELREVQSIVLTGYNCRYASSMKVYAFTEMPADWNTADYTTPAAVVDSIPWAQQPQWNMNGENTAAIELAAHLEARYLVFEMYCELDANQVSVGEIALNLTPPKKAVAIWASSYEEGYGGYPHPYATDGRSDSFWLSASTADAKRIALDVENGDLRSITSITFTGYNCRPVTSFKLYAFNQLPDDWSTVDYSAPDYQVNEVSWQAQIAWEVNTTNTALITRDYEVKARYVVLELSCGMDPSQVSVGEITFVTADPSFTVDTSVTGDIGGTVTGGGQVAAGGDKTIAITPDEGYYISSVSVDGTPIALDTLDSSGLALNKANGYTFADVQADHSVEATFKKIFYMLPGASIRLVDNAALRFIAEVSEEFLADLEAKDIDYSLGTLVIPQNMVPAEGLTLETPKVKNIEQTLWQDDFFNHTEGYHVMTGVLYDIPPANYGRELAGRVYLQIGGETIYTDFNEETNVRSLAYVAYMAKNDLNGPTYSPAQMTKLAEYAASYTP